MRVLTVRQPWAWAIIHGGKDIENRVRNIAGDYRGPVAIHVAIADADNAPESLWELHANFYRERFRSAGGAIKDFSWRESDRGSIIGVVDLDDVHTADACFDASLQRALDLYATDPRAFNALPDSGAGGIIGKAIFCSPWAMDEHHHLRFTNPRALDTPIPWRGALGLRKTDMFVTGDWIGAPIEQPAGHSCTPYGCPPGCDSEPIARLIPTTKGTG